MHGVKFEDQNCVFGKPESMTDEQCYSLPAKKTEHNGFPSIESVFELSDEELAIVNKTKRIRLGILGQGMPPVYLQAEQTRVDGELKSPEELKEPAEGNVS
jgi:hypothetical protein